MKSIRISVIVPVYKINEILLKQCLQSFIDQKYNNVEFLIIDDGSPDRCGEICDQFELKDSRIKVIHKKNEGVSVARNYGLSIATGDYILFVDGDDFIDIDSISKIVDVIEKDSCDLIFFKYKKNINGKSEIKESSLTILKKIDNILISKAIISNTEKKLGYMDVCFGSPWGKVFKKSFIDENNIKFPVGIKKSQDRIFMLKAMSFNPKINIVDLYVYNYVENDTSICQAYNKNIVSILENASIEFKNVIENNYDFEERKKLLEEYNYLQFDFLFNMLRLFFFNKEHKMTKNDYKKYIQLCNEKRIFYIKCSSKGMGKKKKIIITLLKIKQYRLLYILMGKIIRMS